MRQYIPSCILTFRRLIFNINFCLINLGLIIVALLLLLTVLVIGLLTIATINLNNNVLNFSSSQTLNHITV